MNVTILMTPQRQEAIARYQAMMLVFGQLHLAETLATITDMVGDPPVPRLLHIVKVLKLLEPAAKALQADDQLLGAIGVQAFEEQLVKEWQQRQEFLHEERPPEGSFNGLHDITHGMAHPQPGDEQE